MRRDPFAIVSPEVQQGPQLFSDANIHRTLCWKPVWLVAHGEALQVCGERRQSEVPTVRIDRSVRLSETSASREKQRPERD